MSDGASQVYITKDIVYKHAIGRSIKGYRHSSILEIVKGVVRFKYEDETGFPKIGVKDFAEIELDTVESYVKG